MLLIRRFLESHAAIVLLICSLHPWSQAFAQEASSSSGAKKSFVIVTEEYPPFIGARLRDNGWTMAVARAILQPAGYDVSLELVPWSRAVKCSKSGRCDGLYLAFYTKERTQWYVFSDPIGEVRTGFYKLKSRDISFTELADLRGYLIGMTRDAAISPEFDRADYLSKQEVEDDSVNVLKLLKGRVDLVATPEAVFRHLIVTSLAPEHHDKFEFMSPYLSVQNLHMAISRKSPDYEQKLRDFNQGLKRIMADGTYAKIRRSFGF